MEKISLDSLVTVVADRFVALTRRQQSHTEDSIMTQGTRKSAPPSSDDGKWADMGWRGLDCRGLPNAGKIIKSGSYSMLKTAVIAFIDWYGISWLVRCLDRIISEEYAICDCCETNTRRRIHILGVWNRMFETTDLPSIDPKPRKQGIPATIGEGIPVSELPNPLDGRK